MAVAIGGLALAAWYFNRPEDKEIPNIKDVESNLNEGRDERFFTPANNWAENLKAGLWPFSYPHARAPITQPLYIPAVPSLAGAVDWALETNRWLRDGEYQQMFQENYQNAYSTELAGAIQAQLVDGFWDETVYTGDLAIRTHLNLEEYHGSSE